MTFSEKCLCCLLVDVVRSTYAKLAHLDLINKNVIELIFKLNILFVKSAITDKFVTFCKRAYIKVARGILCFIP